jgi:hypothetical protein
MAVGQYRLLHGQWWDRMLKQNRYLIYSLLRFAIKG